MAAEQSGRFRPYFRIFSLLSIALLLVFAVIFYGELKKKSYEKVKPITIELTVLVINKTDLLVQYDYGYGFIAIHEQRIDLVPDSSPQNLSINISSWKAVRRLRLMSEKKQAVQLQSISLKKGVKLTKLLTTLVVDNKEGVLLMIDDVSDVIQKSSEASL